MSQAKEQLRKRGSSISKAIDESSSPSTAAGSALTTKTAPTTTQQQKKAPAGLLSDLYTFRWMTVPASSAKIAGLIFVLWLNWRIFTPNTPNPFDRLLFLSHPVPLGQVLLAEPGAALRGDTLRYQKGYDDLWFVAYYLVVLSCVRQTTTLHIFKPFARWWGITNQRKQDRFIEQAYALLYWGLAGAFGVYVMSKQESWWYNLEHLWIKYPHWQMRPELKFYYLFQAAYWLQQALVMLLRLEAPRKDYYELIAHHLVTLWLIYWSYLVNLTMIGTTVFVCMDVPDTFLALAKGLNYLSLEKLSTAVFGVLMVVWTYFRIYLSAYTLWSVWVQFDLIPSYTREWNPPKGWWLVWWMRYQIFAPLFLLLLLNIFWYGLMWRIMYRAFASGAVEDEREEGEYDEEEAAKQEKINAAKSQ